VTALGGVEVLRRADGVLLIGEMAGSGYRTPPALVRRADGQTVQLTPLLYLLLEAIDGERDVEQVAAAVSARLGRTVTPQNVRTLVDEKLRPLGLLTLADGSQPQVRKSNPLLALRLRCAVTDPQRTRALTSPFARLFHPVLVTGFVVAFLAVCWWVFFEKGLASATYQAFDKPGLLLLVVAVTVLSAGFHEFGHAAAARYGGATPGVMGMGVYLIWPAFYTDVTDSYRLGRAGRVRTDLGGLYFNAIVAVAISAVWWATGYDALLLVVATQILQMLRQLTPLVRFDGYHVLADLTGVPDLFQRIGPTLRGLLPWHWHAPETKVLKPWARAVVTLWVLVVVPMLLFSLAMMVLAAPRVLGTAWQKFGAYHHYLAQAWAQGDAVRSAAGVIAMAAIALPIVGSGYVLARVLRKVVTSVWRRTRGHPGRRTLAGALAAVMVAGVAWAWWPDGHTYRPIQPTERGTILDAIGVMRPVAAPVQVLRTGQQGTAYALWGADQPRPTRAHPQLALIMVPRPADDSSEAKAAAANAPTWVFPVNKPLAPGPGDNQALAVNTQDGTVVYDTAFALVWVNGDQQALNRNEAYAFASCTHCAAVSVGFQVVLVVGQNHVAAPQNISGSLNYHCVNCLTYALAKQLFITLPRPLSRHAHAQLGRLWKQIARFGRRIEAGKVPVRRIEPRLQAYQNQILGIIRADEPDAIPSAPPTSTMSPAASPSGPRSASPSAGTTAGPLGSTVTTSSTTATSPASTSPSPSTSTPTPTPTTTTPSPTPTPTATSTASTTPTTTASPTGTSSP
jgi:putative peptide zinc metalloprotease protein